MSDKDYEFELLWFIKGDEGRLVGSVWLEGVSDDDIRHWFDEEGDVGGCYVVEEQHKEKLEHISGCRIDLDKYVYYVEDVVAQPL